MKVNKFAISPRSLGGPETMPVGTIVRIAAIVCLVVVLLISIIVLICCCGHRRKAKKKKANMKNANSATVTNVRNAKSLSHKVRPNAGLPLKRPVSRVRKPANKNRQPVGFTPNSQVLRAPQSSEKKPGSSSPLKMFSTSTPLPFLDKLAVSQPLPPPPVKDPLSKVEETQPDEESKPQATAITMMETYSSDTGATEAAVVSVVEQQYVCYENGMWQTVEQFEQCESQFSFQLESGHTFSADY